MEIEVWGRATTTYIGSYFEWNGSTNTKTQYYYAGGQRIAFRRGSTLNYLLGDHLGSSSLTVDSITPTGSIITRMLYTPWGENRVTAGDSRTKLGNMPTTYQYTGQRKAEAGLYYYVARFYDPMLDDLSMNFTIGSEIKYDE